MKKNRVLILFIIAGILLFFVLRLINFNGLYGQDAHEYLRCAKELKAHFFSAQLSPFFPPFYPLLGAALGFAMPIPLALQFISVISFSLTLFILYLIIQKAFPKNKYTFIFLFCFGFLSPYLLRSACCVMSDSLANLQLVAILYCLIICYETNSIPYFLGAVFLTALCFLTRFASAVPIAVMFSLLLTTKTEIKFSKFIFITFSIIVPFATLVFIFDKELFSQAIHHPLFAEISPFNFFKSSFSCDDGHLAYSFPNWVFMLYPFIHPGFIFIGCVLLFFIPKNIFSIKAIQFSLVPAIIYLLFLSFLPTQNIRLQTLIFPFLLVLYAPAFENIIQKISQKTQILALVSITQLFFVFFALRTIIKINRVEKQIAAFLIPLQKHYHSLYELGSEGIIQSYNINIHPISLDTVKPTGIKESSLLLIQPKEFEKQWHGKLPGQNFEFINKNMQLIELNSFDNNWKLYLLKRKE